VAEILNKEGRTLRINDDIILILSKRITSDETSEIVKQINKIVKLLPHL
jgi:hypothetical protein